MPFCDAFWLGTNLQMLIVRNLGVSCNSRLAGGIRFKMVVFSFFSIELMMPNENVGNTMV